MSTTLTAKASKGLVLLSSEAIANWYRLSVEESRHLRAELERAEEEAGRKSAFQEWFDAPHMGTRDNRVAWNAAIEAVLGELDKLTGAPIIPRVLALKEPVE